MPTALRIKSYRIYFYAYDCQEPRHMHVDSGLLSAKFWLEPTVALVVNVGVFTTTVKRN